MILNFIRATAALWIVLAKTCHNLYDFKSLGFTLEVICTETCLSHKCWYSDIYIFTKIKSTIVYLVCFMKRISQVFIRKQISQVIIAWVDSRNGTFYV